MENHNENNRLATIEAVLAEVAEQRKRSQEAAEQWSAAFALELKKSQEAFDLKNDALTKQLKEV